MIKFDFNRIRRTLIQSLIGALASVITMIASDFSEDGLITAGVQVIVTVASAVLMNMKTQLDDMTEEDFKIADSFVDYELNGSEESIKGGESDDDCK